MSEDVTRSVHMSITVIKIHVYEEVNMQRNVTKSEAAALEKIHLNEPAERSIEQGRIEVGRLGKATLFSKEQVLDAVSDILGGGEKYTGYVPFQRPADATADGLGSVYTGITWEIVTGQRPGAYELRLDLLRKDGEAVENTVRHRLITLEDLAVSSGSDEGVGSSRSAVHLVMALGLLAEQRVGDLFALLGRAEANKAPASERSDKIHLPAVYQALHARIDTAKGYALCASPHVEPSPFVTDLISSLPARLA